MYLELDSKRSKSAHESVLRKCVFCVFTLYGYRGILALNLTSAGLKYPPEVRVRHETCSTICGTHVQAILDQKNLTGLAGGVKERQNMAQNGPGFYISLASEPSRGP